MGLSALLQGPPSFQRTFPKTAQAIKDLLAETGQVVRDTDSLDDVFAAALNELAWRTRGTAPVRMRRPEDA